jgi:hypothetical protein
MVQARNRGKTRETRGYQSWMSSAAVSWGSCCFVRQVRHRHPLVPGAGTGSVCGRSEHQQSCPGLQDMGELHCEQKAFMVGASSVKPR